MHYEWKNKWHLLADPRFHDHFSIKELLAKKVYDAAILTSARNQARCERQAARTRCPVCHQNA